MMQNKKKYGVRYPELEKRGWLDGWYEEYYKVDKVLTFEIETLSDL
jgi:hypothetical protein